MAQVKLTPEQLAQFAQLATNFLLGNNVLRDALRQASIKTITVHNASPRFCRLHESRLRAALNNSPIPNIWSTITLEHSSLSERPFHYITFELIVNANGEYTFSPLRERDLFVLEDWESRNANYADHELI